MGSEKNFWRLTTTKGWGAQKLGKIAGGTVVHISSGVSALVLAGLIGSRSSWPKGIKPPHDITQILIGTGLLWFGWFGFNGGSQLSVCSRLAPSMSVVIGFSTKT